MGYTEKIKALGIDKYDGKKDLTQWLWCYSMPVELASGNNDTKVIYFSICIEVAPLNWLDSLHKTSIDTWEDLKKMITSNFTSAMQCQGNPVNLAQIK